MKVYSRRTCCLVGQEGCCEGIYWECVWFGGTGRAL